MLSRDNVSSEESIHYNISRPVNNFDQSEENKSGSTYQKPDDRPKPNPPGLYGSEAKPTRQKFEESESFVPDSVLSPPVPAFKPETERPNTDRKVENAPTEAEIDKLEQLLVSIS